MAEKKLFWLQLKNTYFNQLIQKKMRRQENGIEMQVIYLRMMLLSLDNNGYIYYQGVYEGIAEELAEKFNEPVDIVEKTIDFLTPLIGFKSQLKYIRGSVKKQRKLRRTV